MKNALYGRMRMGRCITVEEIAAHMSIVGEDQRLLGCSADVLDLLDQKCSGRTECSIRGSDISAAIIIKPCFPGLNQYLEAYYICITGTTIL